MQDLMLGGPFSNHLVLQRDRENALWGWDLPGQRVIATIEGGRRRFEPAAAIANSLGQWSMRLPCVAAGGPYRIRISGSSEVVLTDVLFGEVWLASGQSHMELSVGEAELSIGDLSPTRTGAVRVLQVPHRAAKVAESQIEAAWCVCNPQSVVDTSAVGYSFAVELEKRLNVPVGIILATWGESSIESWISLEALRPVMPELPVEMAKAARDSTQVERIREEYLERVKAWEHDSLPADPGNLGLLDKWASANFDDSQWELMDLPRFWQNEGLNFNGVVWFRKEIDLPKSWVGRELRLSLGVIDDYDQTYFNGVLVGEHPDGTPNANQIRREYRVHGALVRPGRNVIAVRVFDHGADGGFAGPRSALTLSKAEGSTKIIALAGTWKYAVELEIPLIPRQVFRTYPSAPRVLTEQDTPAALFHGMIAPIVPYGIAGFLWYSGESNLEQYRTYRERLVALVRDWRTRFGQGTLPFLLVQLPGFPGGDMLPYFREVQAQACQELGVFMASAVDLGESNQPQPRRLAEVSLRLAKIALHEVYGERDVPCRGPEVTGIRLEGERVRLLYRFAEGLRTTDASARVRGFELAGPDGQYRPANGIIDGDSVVVESTDVNAPKSLRYAWSDCPDLNLINGAGLPALPFRTDGAAPK